MKNPFSRRRNDHDADDARPYELQKEQFDAVSAEHASIVEKVAPALLVVEPDHVRVGDEYCRTLFIRELPGSLRDYWLNELYRFDEPLDISIYINPLDAAETVKSLTGNIARVEADVDAAARAGKPRNERSVRELNDMVNLRKMIGAGRTKPFEVSFVITVRARSKDELDKICERIESKFGSMLAKTRPATDRHLDGFLSGLPALKNEIASKLTVHKVHTQGVAVCFPFVASELNHGAGAYFGQNLITGGSVIVNRFDRTRVNAWNMAIIGATGQGKSVAAKTDALWWIMQGTPAIFIDPNGEYEALAQQFGGVFVTLGVDSPTKINPLDFTHLIPATQEELLALESNPLKEKIGFLQELLAVMIRTKDDGKPGPPLSDLQMAVLERSLRAAYGLAGYDVNRVGTLHGAQPQEMPILSDVAFALSKIAEAHEQEHVRRAADDLHTSLQRYTGSGSLAGIFDHRSNVSLANQRIVVFNIESLRDSNYAPVMHMVLEYIRSELFTQKQATSGQKKLLYVDEAHILMQFDETSRFLTAVARQCRKYFVGFTLITQDADTMLTLENGEPNPEGRALVGQCQTIMLLAQKGAALGAVQSAFRLNEAEAAQLAMLDRGQSLIIVENRDRAWTHMIGVLSPQLLELVETDPSQRAENRRRQQALAQQQLQGRQLPRRAGQGDAGQGAVPPQLPPRSG